MSIIKWPYCADSSGTSLGWCCNDIMDFLNNKCDTGRSRCSNDRYYDSSFKYMLCPYNPEKCRNGPSIVISNTFSRIITVLPLSFTEVCFYNITVSSSVEDKSLALKLEIVDLYLADVRMFVNYTSMTTAPTYSLYDIQVGNITQFNLTDKILLYVRTNAVSRDSFLDFARLSFRLYLEPYERSKDLSEINGNLTDDSNSTTSEEETAVDDSIFGTYSIYFNA